MARLARSAPTDEAAPPKPAAIPPAGGVPPPPLPPKPAPPPPPPSGDGPASRIAKYIPAETVAFFLGAKNLIESAAIPKETAELWTNICFVIGFAGTPLVLFLQREVARPWIVNTVLATIAFPIWVAALKPQFGWLSAISPFVAGMILLIYTFLAGIVKPVK